MREFFRGWRRKVGCVQVLEPCASGATGRRLGYRHFSAAFDLGWIGLCHQAQGAGTLPSRGPSAPEQNLSSYLLRPEGPVHSPIIFESTACRNVRPFRPQEI
jgi:hypothetical protein